MKIAHLLSATALATASFIIPQTAWAQTAPATPPQTAEQPVEESQDDTPLNADGSEAEGDIVVTGSRIARPEVDGILPGVQVNAAQIQARGFTNALDILNDIPLVGPSGASFNGNAGGQTASLGAAFVDLLDLGTQRTLTLVNGRRFVSGNSASLFVAENATGVQVDVNSIPSSLIQRVDVLTVGGAAAYGSDAIAGVVNYILREDYEGVEARALSGVSDRGDAANQQLSFLAGMNFLDGRGNITISGEYTHLDGLQTDAREFRLARPSTVASPFNGGVRNPNFVPAIIDVTGLNNGAFLRSTDDGAASNLFGQGFINNGLSFNGSIFNALATPANAAFAPSSPSAVTVTTSNIAGFGPAQFIGLQNGIGAAGTSFFNTAVQLVSGTPGATLIAGNGLNGRTTPIANLPITTFAPTALPAGVTASQVFAQFSVAPPAGATTAQLNALAINVLQANRPTAREFFTNNPNVNINAFIGTFIPGVPRVANTDTSLVTVAGVQVPLNQVLPFVAVPLEFTADGSVRTFTAAQITPTQGGTFAQSPGSTGGFSRSIENIVLRTQQDRYIGNLLAKFDVTDWLTVFSENLFSHSKNTSLRNSPSQNFLTTTAENAGLVLNVNNPFLDAADRAALNAVGINSATRGGAFVLTRQNQDIFGNNPFTSEVDTYRIVGGLRSNFRLIGQDWNAEVSGTYGRAEQKTQSTQINDVEYQLALDAVDQGIAMGGAANGNIVCRAQIFPAQYLGRTPTGTSANLTRLPGADGIPTEIVVLPQITQAQIDACRPLNPFGFNQMSAEAKAYVRQDNLFTNISEQTFLQAFVSGGLFDLPGGKLSISLNGEYRKEELNFSTDLRNRLGQGRAAPSANTVGFTETYEFGGEALIPIFGDDFGLGELEFTPAIRVSKQSGEAGTFRNLAGTVITPKSEGDWETIYTLGGRWAPIRDITIRGNYTRSVRNPGVVELFLGGQPSFTTPVDPCGPASIGTGTAERAATRRTNCRAAVIAAGLAPDSTSADAFLAAFVPLTGGLQGSFSGAPGLLPEKGESYTVGGVLTPRWVPGLTVSVDYISLDLDNIIAPTGLADALRFCFESPTFPDTSAQTGANTCGFFTRDAAFQVANGFASGYINLAATELRALNINASYRFELPAQLGELALRTNAYHLIRYTDSAAGDFSDANESAGTFTRPKWEVQTSARYENGGFFTQLTWNYREKTRLFSAGIPATTELLGNVEYPSTNVFDLTFGAQVNDNFRLQGNIINLTDQNFAGELGFFNAGYIDQIGRRFQVAATVNF